MFKSVIVFFRITDTILKVCHKILIPFTSLLKKYGEQNELSNFKVLLLILDRIYLLNTKLMIL
ncbi:hypothetical protein LEP1GSC008_3758 [Leptospira kirschneri serovar Bulgarica str. Nikolaevo]|uniref:Uncharacterized protein n=1 Tax=Leptospira kirschneri serovar Bulgarica str. Nikolaevo TaxID=1240687 RepID=M6FLY7_9LEPT|nr:hypothetical protein LEP1GSC008_3758 [Leptospira kirschneri serovar Bulgarica str. Nikolaevo]